MTTTHVRIDETLKEWMDKNRKPGDSVDDQIRKAFIAQAQYDTGIAKEDVTTKNAKDARRRIAELLEL